MTKDTSLPSTTIPLSVNVNALNVVSDIKSIYTARPDTPAPVVEDLTSSQSSSTLAASEILPKERTETLTLTTQNDSQRSNHMDNGNMNNQQVLSTVSSQTNYGFLQPPPYLYPAEVNNLQPSAVVLTPDMFQNVSTAFYNAMAEKLIYNDQKTSRPGSQYYHRIIHSHTCTIF